MRAPADRSSETELLPSTVAGACGASFSDTVHLGGGKQQRFRVATCLPSLRLSTFQALTPGDARRTAARCEARHAISGTNGVYTAQHHSHRGAAHGQPGGCLSRTPSPPWPGMKLLVRHAGGE